MVEEESPGVVGRFETVNCVICREDFKNDKAVKITEKGIMNLISFSKEHGHLMLHTHLTECISKTRMERSWYIKIVVKIILIKEG